MNINRVNDQRDLLNFEYYHLYNVVKHNSKGTLFPRRTLIIQNVESTDQAEYGVIVTLDNGNRRLWKFTSYERCVQERNRHPDSQIVRLGRDSRSRTFDFVNVAAATQEPDTRIFAHADESGNIENPEFEAKPRAVTFQLISNELTELGFAFESGAHPPARILRDLSMRYNDIVPEEFAAAVVRHCELPKVSSEDDTYDGKRPFLPPEEKAAWYDTPAGQAWVKENPIPRIFNVPTPDFLKYRRDYA